MKKWLFAAIFLALVCVFPIRTMAAVDIHIGISLPPPIVFAAPPDVIVLPDTNDVYVVPDIEVDLFFWNGWWWRLWEGRWYRSPYYKSGWVYYDHVPRFYFDVDPVWRVYYRDHGWYGHRWNYERIPNRQLQQNWKVWYDSRHWERQRTWGVQDYQPRPQSQRQELRHQRQVEYQHRPEVQRHEQQSRHQVQHTQSQNPRNHQIQEPQKQQRPPQVAQPQRQPQPIQQPSQTQGDKYERESHHGQPQGKHEGEGGEKRR